MTRYRIRPGGYRISPLPGKGPASPCRQLQRRRALRSAAHRHTRRKSDSASYRCVLHWARSFPSDGSCKKSVSLPCSWDFLEVALPALVSSGAFCDVRGTCRFLSTRGFCAGKNWGIFPQVRTGNSHFTGNVVISTRAARTKGSGADRGYSWKDPGSQDKNSEKCQSGCRNCFIFMHIHPNLNVTVQPNSTQYNPNSTTYYSPT